MTNCFEMKCPKCGDEDHIDVAATVFVRLTADGTDADISGCGDHEWEPQSRATCAACDYVGAVQDFEKAAPLPPDPEGMNDGRAAWAGAALRHFQSATGTDDGDALTDLLGDLLHWCDRNRRDFDADLSRARMHYEAETKPPEEE